MLNRLLLVCAFVAAAVHGGTLSHCDGTCSNCTTTNFVDGQCMLSTLSGYNSTQVSCNSELSWCVAVAVHTEASCSTRAIARINPVCNLCQYDWEANSWFRLGCDLSTHHLDFREGCDSTCNNCTGRFAFPQNSCNLDQSAGNLFVVNEGLYQCSTFSQSYWRGLGCGGGGGGGQPVFTHVDSQNHCDGGTFVTCGQEKQQGASEELDGVLSVCSDEECGQCNSSEFTNRDCIVSPALPGMSSYQLTCNSGKSKCPDVQFYSDSNCASALLGEVHPACGICQWDWEVGSWFRLDCDETSHNIDFREGCDPTCSNCSNRASYPIGSCLHDPSSGLFIVNRGLDECSTFTHKVWATSKACHGEPTYSHVDAQVHCDGGMSVVCRVAAASAASDDLSDGAIAGIIVGAIALVGIVLVVIIIVVVLVVKKSKKKGDCGPQRREDNNRVASAGSHRVPYDGEQDDDLELASK